MASSDACENTQGKQERIERLAPHRFQPGNPGRPKGSRNKLGEDFIAALAEDFAQHGKPAIEKVRCEKPDQYLKVIAQVVPKEVHYKMDEVDELSDDAIEAKLLELLAARSESGSAQAGRGTGTAARAPGSTGPLPN